MKKIKSLFNQNRKNYWFWAFWAVIGILFFTIPLLSLDAGNSGDEDSSQIPQGKYVLDYFRSGGADTTCLTFSNLKYYGSSFDIIAAAFNETFHIDNIHTTRHIFNSFLGWLAILFVGLIAVRVGGWRAGLFATVLLFLSPRFLGHSFNNPKDIPFATAVIAAFYFMLVFFDQFPKIKWYTVLLLIFSIAFSISIRIGGLILFGYFALFGFLFLIKIGYHNREEFLLKTKNSKRKPTQKWRHLMPPTLVGKLILFGIGICIAGYFLGLLLWPYALQSPIKNPLEAFGAMAKFEVAIKQNFEGLLQSSDVLPWYYTPKYILISIPVAVMMGIILYPFVGGWKKGKRLSTFMLYFIFIFPIFWLVYTRANVYGGWRHSLFAYPPMAVIAGLGFNALVDFVKNKNLKIVMTILPFLLLIMPMRHIIKNHPYEYIYFNQLSGGFNNAYGNYEMDYYYHSTREATQWIVENVKPNEQKTQEKIKVATWHLASVKYFLRNDTTTFQPVFVRWYQRGEKDWDYAIFPITGIAPDQIKGKHFPPKNTIHTIDVDGKPICLILKREDKSDFYAKQFQQQMQLDSAIYYFQKALEIDPYNETALVSLSQIFLSQKREADAKQTLNKFLEVDPMSEIANHFLAFYFLQNNQLDEASKICQKVIKYNRKFADSYILAAQIYLQQQNLNKAEKVLLKMLDNDAMNDQGAKMLVQIYRSQGLGERDAYKKLYKKMMEKFKKEREKEQYELYKKEYDRL